MSIKIMTMVWDAFPASGSELLCMLAMADWANDDGGSLHPSMRAVAEKIRVSEKQARRIVQGLVEAGYLYVVGNAHGGAPGTTKQWVINVKRLREMAAKKQHEVDQTAPTSVTPPASVTPPTGVPDPSHRCPETAPTGVPDPSHPWEPNHHRTTNRTTNEPSVARNRALLTIPGVDPQLVEDWRAVRSAKRAGPITVSVVKGMEREAEKAGIGLEAAIEVCCTNGWAGFRAEWHAKQAKPVAPAQSFRERDHAAASEIVRQFAPSIAAAPLHPPPRPVAGVVIDVAATPAAFPLKPLELHHAKP